MSDDRRIGVFDRRAIIAKASPVKTIIDIDTDPSELFICPERRNNFKLREEFGKGGSNAAGKRTNKV